MSEPEAVLLNGVYGVGKTTVLIEMADRMEAAGLRYAALDLDWLSWAWSDEGDEAGDDHPNVGPLLLEHLDLIVGNLRRRGNDRFALAGSIASAPELDRLRDAMPMPLRVILLTAPLDVVRSRLGEEATTGRLGDAEQTEAWASSDGGPERVSADVVVRNDRSIAEVAGEVLAWTGWLGRTDASS